VDAQHVENRITACASFATGPAAPLPSGPLPRLVRPTQIVRRNNGNLGAAQEHDLHFLISLLGDEAGY
jgi:hypothetical protein